VRLASRWLLAGRSIVAAWIAITAVAVLITWLGSLYEPGAELRVRQFWVIGGIGFCAAVFVFGICYTEMTRWTAAEAVRTAPARLPRAIYSVVEPWVGDGPRSELRRVILILTPTDLLGGDDLVSVFHREELGAAEAYEKFVGLGVVQTINRSGQPQVVVFYEARGAGDILGKVRERDAVALKSLVIRPGAQFPRINDWRTLDE
jgi:hypothetical protein